MASFVRIKLDGVGGYAEVDMLEGDTVALLAERACAELPSWRMDAAQLSLHLVAADGDEEPSAEVTSRALLSSDGRLGVCKSLASAGVSSGAWLIARKVATQQRSLSNILRVGMNIFSADASSLAGAGVRCPWDSAGRTQFDSTTGDLLHRVVSVDNAGNVVFKED